MSDVRVSQVSFNTVAAVAPEIQQDSFGGGGKTYPEVARIARQVKRVVRGAHTARIERIAARKDLKAGKIEARRAQEIRLFNESALLTEQIRQEIARLQLEAGSAFADAEMIAMQIEFMQMQIEELDIAFCLMMIAGID